MLFPRVPVRPSQAAKEKRQPRKFLMNFGEHHCDLLPGKLL